MSSEILVQTELLLITSSKTKLVWSHTKDARHQNS